MHATNSEKLISTRVSTHPIIIIMTRSIQRAQTSAERQHNRIAEWFLQCKLAMQLNSLGWRAALRASVLCVLTTWQFFPDPDNGLPDQNSDVDCHQNVISWSLGHTPALHKISSKSVGNFFDNPVNPDFGLWTPGSERWSSRSSPKFNHLVPGHALPLQEFRQNPFTTFSVIRRTDNHTNRQTDKQTEVKT